MSDTVGGPTLHAVRRLATNVVLTIRTRRFSASRGQVEAGGVRFQSRKKLGRRLIDIRDGLQRKLLSMTAILLFIGSVAGAGRSSASSDHLLRFRQPQRRFTRVFPIASVLIGVGAKPIPKLESWIHSAARPMHPQPICMGRRSRAQGSAARAAPGLWLAIGATCGPESSRTVLHGRNMRRKSRSRAGSCEYGSHRSKVRHPPYEPFLPASRLTSAH